MAKARAIHGEGGKLIGYGVECPGCGNTHIFNSRWMFNGDKDKPTFRPSMLEKSGHYVDGNPECWCKWNREHPEEAAPFTCGICHSFVTDGHIQFLDDCTHNMAGQTMELPDIK